MNDWTPLTKRKMDEEFEELDFVQPHKKMKVNLVLCEDVVSRKAVIAETYRDCTDVKSDEDAYKVLQRIRDGINALPPVQPKLQSNNDCISREYLKQDMIRYGWKHPDSTITEYVDSLPSVQPEQRTGHWIVYDHGYGCKYYQCSICKGFDRGEKGKYCKWCGAKMLESEGKE